uniref:Uncharacterized protein n=1 Tax=Setaria viridis TaxID=4556 RepID=A0A4U6V0Q6_SETVI|nr:hypothetical protein SEVIR_4G125901v2 [Setaria viridis]
MNAKWRQDYAHKKVEKLSAAVNARGVLPHQGSHQGSLQQSAVIPPEAGLTKRTQNPGCPAVFGLASTTPSKAAQSLINQLIVSFQSPSITVVSGLANLTSDPGCVPTPDPSSVFSRLFMYSILICKLFVYL